MGSMRIVMRQANQVIGHQRQQICGGIFLQSNRMFGNRLVLQPTTCMFIGRSKWSFGNGGDTTITSDLGGGVRFYSNWTLKSERESLLNKGKVQSTVVSLDAVSQKRKRGFSNNEKKDTKKSDATASSVATPEECFIEETAHLGLFARFKLMYKKYWYVLVPVHIVTSIGWFGGFYFMSKSGVDVASLLHMLSISESIIEKVQHSNMGHYAIAYLCYKIATPLRYAVTLGGTTVSIKYLVAHGHIKPVPTKTEFMAMIGKKKDSISARFDNKTKP